MECTYRCVASMLRRHTDVAGLTAYGWLYDPQLAEISPRLSYLRQRPLERGAISVRGDTSDFDIRERDRKIANAEAALRGRRIRAGRPQDPVAQARHPALGRSDPARLQLILQAIWAVSRNQSRPPRRAGINSSSAPILQVA